MRLKSPFLRKKSLTWIKKLGKIKTIGTSTNRSVNKVFDIILKRGGIGREILRERVYPTCSDIK